MMRSDYANLTRSNEGIDSVLAAVATIQDAWTEHNLRTAVVYIFFALEGSQTWRFPINFQESDQTLEECFLVGASVSAYTCTTSSVAP